MKKIKPIFILGGARNGTTWLGNILINHPQIGSAQHPLHWGIHESNIYKNHKYWGIFENIDNYIEFLEIYASADFFNLVEGNKKTFYLNPAANFYVFFFNMMDHYAKKNKFDYWVTKLDPIFYTDIRELHRFLSLVKKRYGEILFIGIQRDFNQCLNSYLRMEGRNYKYRKIKIGQFFATILGTARYHSQYINIKKLLKQYNGLYIKFEDLKSQQHDTLLKIKEFLKLQNNFDKNNLTAFKPNTSFSDKRSHSEKKLKNDAPFLKSRSITYSFVQNIPFLSRTIIYLYEKLKKKSNPLYWRLLKSKYFSNELMKEFKNSNREGLINYLINSNRS